MSLIKRLEMAAVASVLLAAPIAAAEELPASFPGDVSVADYMTVASVTEVKETLMVDLHAPGKSVADVVEWFTSALEGAGWTSEGQQVSERDAILAYRKNGRRCGVIVTNFILNSSMQMDEKTKGITLQITGKSVRADDAVNTAEESADAASQ